MADPIHVGGSPIVTLHASCADGIFSAQIAPGRGMMLLGAQARIGSDPAFELLAGPPLNVMADLLDGGPSDFAGNAAFSFGGAILLPFANRIRGAAVPGRRAIFADLGTTTVELRRNWGGQMPGAAQYAMHGLLLDVAIPEVEQPSPSRVIGRLSDWDFGGRWPSRISLEMKWRLSSGALELAVTATNVGNELLPLGVGWHPYFRAPSGQRAQLRLELPASGRVRLNNYDEVLPIGQIDRVSGTPYDFSAAGGARLDELYLDDTFVNLHRNAAEELVVRLIDPAARTEIRLTSPTKRLKAVQVYAPLERPVVVVEPQFNLGDPFWPGWDSDIDTGMVALSPGQSAEYRVRTECRVFDGDPPPSGNAGK